MKTTLFGVFGFLVGFGLVTMGYWCYGMDFHEHGRLLAEWWASSVCAGSMVSWACVGAHFACKA